MTGQRAPSPVGTSAEGSAALQCLRPFRKAGVLEAIDVLVVAELGGLLAEEDPEVLLALSLAVRAPRHGHVCVELRELSVEQLLTTRDEESMPARDGLRLPLDRGEWIERVARSPLVTSGRLDAEAGALARPFVLDAELLYTDCNYGYQKRLAEQLGERMRGLSAVADAALLQRGLEALFGDGSLGSRTSSPIDRQRLAAATAVLRSLTVISGGPGTGKTFTVRGVLTLLWAQWAAARPPGDEAVGPSVALAAPTGKAAARMSEAIQIGLPETLPRIGAALPAGSTVGQLQRFLDGLRPTTLHRLLGWDPTRPTRFRHDSDDPVPCDVLIVDEASMVDLALMSKLVDALPRTARLVLLGDQRQLASVEAGTVLADLCGPTSASELSISGEFAERLERVAGLCGLPSAAELTPAAGPQDAIVQLRENHRFGRESGIGQFARACLDDDFDLERAVSILTSDRSDTDVRLIGHGPNGSLRSEIQAAVVAGYRPYLERLQAGPPPGESLEDLHRKVLDELGEFRILCAHRRGHLGAAGMNQAAIDLLTHTGVVRRGTTRSATDDQIQAEFWVGRPILVTSNDYVVGLHNGDVGVVVRDAQGTIKVAFPVSTTVRYVAPSRLPDHETTFAMTIHKSQGSEFAHAMVVLPEEDSPILTRELVYTAVTRARRRMTLVAEPPLLATALSKRVRRASGLGVELWAPAR